LHKLEKHFTDKMAQIEIRLPKMGESVTEATITNWLKNIGETVGLDEPLVEVATDKVDNELPSEAQGTLIKRFFEKDQVAQVGDVIAIISTDGTTDVVAEQKIEAKVENVSFQNVNIPASSNNNGNSNQALPLNSESNKFYSPLVRSIAEKEGISSSVLDSISGTGQDGRVTKKDILTFIENKVTNPVMSSNPTIASPVNQNATPKDIQTPTQQNTVHSPQNAHVRPEPLIITNPGDEIIEMDRMRKLIAEHMVMSKHTSPHVTSFVEADVTNIVLWRNKIKKDFEKREGENITFTPIFMEAIAKAIKDFPMINISVSGTTIIKKRDINLGMATALPSGNLIVPVIKNADRLNLTGLTKAVNDLARKARDNKLKPEDIQGGTYTVTNVGSFGNVMGTPIINQPQVAILALGAVRKLPAVIETPEGDFIGIRHKMFLSHSYDHRVVDGSLGGQFVRRVADYLEQFDVNREI
jgi:2-oxoglutarate dehydrogenase E2 component (dihydrolipoamide succinyltransferase)